MQAAKLIEAALACELRPELDNDITCDCLKVCVSSLMHGSFRQSLPFLLPLEILFFVLLQSFESA